MDKKFDKKVQLNGVKLHNSEQNTNFFFTQIIEQTSCKYTCKKKKTKKKNKHPKILLQNNVIQLLVRSGSRSSLIAITDNVGGLGVAHVLPSSLIVWGSIVPCL